MSFLYPIILLFFSFFFCLEVISKTSLRIRLLNDLKPFPRCIASCLAFAFFHHKCGFLGISHFTFPHCEPFSLPDSPLAVLPPGQIYSPLSFPQHRQGKNALLHRRICLVSIPLAPHFHETISVCFSLWTSFELSSNYPPPFYVLL